MPTYSETSDFFTLLQANIKCVDARRHPEAEVNFVKPRLLKYTPLLILALEKKLKLASEASEPDPGIIGQGHISVSKAH